MQHRNILARLVVPLLLLAACTDEVKTTSAAPTAAAQSAAVQAMATVKPAADAPVHAVACGCALEAVGHCSESIEVDGEYVALELPVDLGSMPFCKREGLKARVEGSVEGATFVATAFEYAE